VALDDLRSQIRTPRGGSARRVGSRAFLFWLLALGTGGISALLIHAYIKSSVNSAVVTTSKIAVAAANLQLATALAEEHVQMVDWPDVVPAPNAVKDAKTILGRVLVTKVVKGQILLDSMFAPRESGKGLAALIPPSMRAVAVRVDDVVGVAGFIHPEDRVDVIVTIRPSKPDNAEPMSKVILQNVEVLTVGQEIETKDGVRNKPVSVTVATLLVSPEGSEKLALAASQGKLLLSLRSRSDSRETVTSGVVPTALLGTPIAPPPPKPAQAVAPPPPVRKRTGTLVAASTPVKAAPPPEKPVVEILRGDRLEQRRLDGKRTP
jgi:pilus assembly protein CpaB